MLTIIFGSALLYIIIGMIIITISCIINGDNIVFISDMWLVVLLWWLAIIVFIYKKIKKKIKQKKRMKK